VKLSVVVLTHNAGPLLGRCVRSVLADDPGCGSELIVVDNASHDGSVEALALAFDSRVRILRSATNGGFACGNNLGLRASRGEHICLLNPDTVVRPGAFAALLECMERHPQAGLVGPRVLELDGSLQPSCMRVIPDPVDAVAYALQLDRVFPRSRTLARARTSYASPLHTQRVEASTGCCMLARRAMLNQIGLLDERFFLYCEDVDLFVRARQAGWEAWYVAPAVIEHHHAYSDAFRPLRNVFQMHRSMILFHRKHRAASYPSAVNALLYAGVAARMLLRMAGRAVPAPAWFSRRAAGPRRST